MTTNKNELFSDRSRDSRWSEFESQKHSMQASKQRRSHHHSLHIMISLYGFRRRDIFFRYALGTKKGWQFLLLTIHCMSNSSMNTIATTATARVQFWSLSLYSRFVHTSIHYTNTDTRQCTIICIHTIYTLCANVYDTCACILLHCMWKPLQLRIPFVTKNLESRTHQFREKMQTECINVVRAEMCI